MIMGYGIIAVPTGIVTAEMTRIGLGDDSEPARSVDDGTRALICPRCYAGDHDDDAAFCKHCGTGL